MQKFIEALKAAIMSESYEDRAGRSVISVKSALDIIDRLAAEQEEKVERCFKCVNKFKIPVYDEDERVTDKYGAVDKGSIWSVSAHRGEQPVRLLLRSGNSDFSYIDISVETLKGYFEEVAAEQPKAKGGGE